MMTLAFFVASTASAFEFTVISNAPPTIFVDDTFTIDLELENANQDSLSAVDGGILSGLSGFEVVSGQTALWHFVLFCSPSSCFAGIKTCESCFFNPNDLSRSATYTPGDDSIKLVSALGLAPTTADGSIDPGLIGAVNEPSALDATIVLRALVPGIHELAIGFELSIGGQTVQGPTQTLAVHVVPEPGTALLMGLGLAGLAAVRRRRKSIGSMAERSFDVG
jgi:hypothetical protein